MDFERVPSDFLKNIFLAPHNFNDPENIDHGNYVHMQLRNDLYNDILMKIVNCEFSFSSKEEETVKVQEIVECEGSDPIWGIAKNLVSYKGGDTHLISCQDWKVRLK